MSRWRDFRYKVKYKCKTSDRILEKKLCGGGGSRLCNFAANQRFGIYGQELGKRTLKIHFMHHTFYLIEKPGINTW